MATLSLVIFFTACSGSSGDGTLPATDSTPPLITGTSPNATQLALKNTFITLAFNEAVQLPTTADIDIFSFDANGFINELNTIALADNPFDYGSSSNKLIIKPFIDTNDAANPRTLQNNTRYQVNIRNIKDNTGNDMLTNCRFEFATTGFDLIKVAKGINGPCDTPKPNQQPGKLSFVTNLSRTSEISGSTTVTVQRLEGSDGAISVDFATTDGSASNTDYTATSGTLNFADGELSKTITVTILNETEVETDERFTITLTNPSNGATLGKITSHNTVIIDDDNGLAGNIEFSILNSTVNENVTGAVAQITVVRNEGLTGAITVEYASKDGSAVATQDYTSQIGTLNFAEGEVQKTIQIPILNDNNYETNENFSLQLSIIGPANVRLGININHTITIISEDPNLTGTIEFSSLTSNFNEGDNTAIITVSRSPGSKGDISVEFTTSNGSATFGNDYTAKTGVLNFTDGGTLSQTISIIIIDDALLESSENFTISLSNVTGGASLTANTIHTVTIDDNEIAQFGRLIFSITTSSVVENIATGTAIVSVTRNDGNNGSITVNFETINGSAIAGSDYTSRTGTLTFGPGVITQDIIIPIIDNKLVESNESFSISLTTPTGGATLGANTTHVVTITDDELPGILSFETTSSDISESIAGSKISILVNRTNGSDDTVTVNYQTNANGNATAASDFTTKTGTLTFTRGVTQQSIDIEILNDTELNEVIETFSINLTATTGGATLGSITNHQVSIIDNDILTIGFGLKKLKFNWSDYPGATKYRLMENTGSGYVQVGNDIPKFDTTGKLLLSSIINISVHTFDWFSSKYLLEICDISLCISSNEIVIFGQPDSINTIGYIKGVPSFLESDLFGTSVTLSGNGQTMAVGATIIFASGIGSAGSVFIFQLIDDTWIQETNIRISNIEGDTFGKSVSLSYDGNTLAIGAPGDSSSSTGINNGIQDGLAPNSGAVYIYTRSGSTWTSNTYIKADNTTSEDRFGDTVSLSDDGKTLAVSVYLEDSNTTDINSIPDDLATNTGAVYIYSRPGFAWAKQAFIKADNTQVVGFGKSIALSGDGNTLAVEELGNSGSVYVFARTATNWIQESYLKASNAENGDSFGSSVSLSWDGNILAIGANNEDSNSVLNQANNQKTNSGAVYIFSRTNKIWSQQSYLKASNLDIDDFFGASLSLDDTGTILVIGAYGEDSSTKGVNSIPDEQAITAGAAYVFTFKNLSWSEFSYLKANNTTKGHYFGLGISMSGDGSVLAIGAQYDFIAGTTDTLSGAVYLY